MAEPKTQIEQRVERIERAVREIAYFMPERESKKILSILNGTDVRDGDGDGDGDGDEEEKREGEGDPLKGYMQ